MSQLKLSGELIESIQQTLENQDEAAKDPSVALQYMAAAMGYMLASVNAEAGEKREFHGHLCEFSQQVMEDVLGREKPPQQEAFGIWRP